MRYERRTEGVRVSVEPCFSLARSDVGEGSWVFRYRVRLHNEGPEPVQLLFRHWRIHDSAGEDAEVDGEGVVGKQPVLDPGASHAYASHCALRSPVGSMEGWYTFLRADGSRFRVGIPRFDLRAPLPGAPTPGGGRVFH